MGQSNELAFVANATSIEPEPVNKIMVTLLSLYEGATSWYTKMTILSIFTQHYTKTQLKDLVLGFCSTAGVLQIRQRSQSKLSSIP